MMRLPILDGELAGTMGSFVFRWDLDGVAMPDRFFRMASAYLDAAIALFRQMIETGAGTYERALAANFMAEHAVELFFKGAALPVGGGELMEVVWWALARTGNAGGGVLDVLEVFDPQFASMLRSDFAEPVVP